MDSKQNNVKAKINKMLTGSIKFWKGQISPKGNFEIQKYKLGPQLMQKPQNSFEVNLYRFTAEDQG